MMDDRSATRLYSEKRNHRAVTKRFEDFFNHALYEAPEKYEKTPPVVVAEVYTKCFMFAYNSCQSEVLNQLVRQEEIHNVNSIKLLMELQEEESNTGIVRKTDLSLYVSEEKYHSLLIKSGLDHQEPQILEVIREFCAANDCATNKELCKAASIAVEIAWDMLMLKPPAIACTPNKYTKAWHQEYGPLWDDRKPAESLVYLRPLLLYGAGGSVATKALVGNRSTDDIRKSLVDVLVPYRPWRQKLSKHASPCHTLKQFVEQLKQFVEQLKLHEQPYKQAIQAARNIKMSGEEQPDRVERTTEEMDGEAAERKTSVSISDLRLAMTKRRNLQIYAMASDQAVAASVVRSVWLEQPKYEATERYYYEIQADRHSGLKIEGKAVTVSARPSSISDFIEETTVMIEQTSMATSEPPLTTSKLELQARVSKLEEIVEQLTKRIAVLEAGRGALFKQMVVSGARQCCHKIITTPTCTQEVKQQEPRNEEEGEEEEDINLFGSDDEEVKQDPEKDDEDDDIELFGSDDEDEKAAEELQRRAAEYEEKKSQKPKAVAKSNIILDVKPWDDETGSEC